MKLKESMANGAKHRDPNTPLDLTLATLAEVSGPVHHNQKFESFVCGLNSGVVKLFRSLFPFLPVLPFNGEPQFLAEPHQDTITAIF